MKNLLILFFVLLMSQCGPDEYHFCDISNRSNDTIVVDLIKIYINEFSNEMDSAVVCKSEVIPHSTEVCMSYCSRKWMFKTNEYFKFVFLKKKNDGKPYMKKDILAVKYATADSLEKWGMLVTYP